jgi:hypothetical protein
VLLVTTLARLCPGEPLWFGACALLPSLLPGQQPVDVRLFYRDDAPDAERELLADAAAARGLQPPLPRRELVRVLLRRCSKQRLPLVGYGLPPQLGRLAAAWRPARDGGFSVIPVTKPCPPGKRTPAERRRRPLLSNGEIEDGDWPRIALKPLDGQRAAIRFQGRGRPDYPQDRAPDGAGGRPKEGYVFPGFFVDLAMLGSVQAAGKRFPDVAAAAAAFGLPPLQNPGRTGDDPAPQVDAALADLDRLAALYLHLLDCHRQTPGSERVTPDQVYSAASYAEGVFEQVGLELPLARSGLPEPAHAYGMGAFFGGDCGIATRHHELPAAYLDITGHYPVAAELAGTFDLLCATKLELVEEAPADLQQLLTGLSDERLLTDRALWRRLGRTVCLVRPQGDPLPHRIPHGKGLLLKIAPLTSQEPLPYLLADLAVAILRGGALPEIVSAFSLRPVPRRRKRLRQLTLPSGHLYDPRRETLFLALAEERLRLAQDTSLPEAERERRDKVIKLIVNAACYGLLCQINIHAIAGEMDVVGLEGSSPTVRVNAVEEPGRWVAPLLAAGVTATGRLLLQLARQLVERAGGTICGWDTDSLWITGLTAAELAQVQAEFERLSPYSDDLKRDPAAPLLLALEPENFDPASGGRLDLHVFATASKNYDLYTHDPDGTLMVRKTSEHGLGHLRTPGHPDRDDRDWIGEGRLYLLARRLGLPIEKPGWWGEPKISVVTLNRPAELARLQAMQPRGRKGTVLRPFSRLAVAHPTPQYARDSDGKRRTPVAPFHIGFDTNTAPWRDLASGAALTLRYPDGDTLTESDLAATRPERLLCDTVGQALEQNSRRPEAKALDQHGNPCGRSTVGLLTPAPTEAIRLVPIGKEARNLERAGITEDPAHTLYGDPEVEAWKQSILPTLRRLDPGALSKGRPSRLQRAQLAHRAARLVHAALSALDQPVATPRNPEEACYLYLKTTSRRTCACGCRTPVTGRARYAGPAHRTRAYRSRRHAAQVDG